MQALVFSEFWRYRKYAPLRRCHVRILSPEKKCMHEPSLRRPFNLVELGCECRALTATHALCAREDVAYDLEDSLLA